MAVLSNKRNRPFFKCQNPKCPRAKVAAAAEKPKETDAPTIPAAVVRERKPFSLGW
jgi:hypothetical protein